MITLATYITLFRIFLVAPIIYLLLTHYVIAAGFLAAVAAVTDMLDGYIARRYHQESTLGALLDPVADKLFILGTFTTLWYHYAGIVPEWFIIVLWAKEALMFVGGAYMLYYRYKPAPARLSGKIAMLCQVFYCLILFFTRYTTLQIPTFLTAVLMLVTVVTLYALIDYAKVGYRILYRRFL